jgi:Cu-Zn family superoxide dismutase
MCFFTDRFRVWQVIGRSVLIHENPDDFRSQPGGDSGRRMACGVIKAWP